jgi:Zn-dependent alcohol dehydrogenase
MEIKAAVCRATHAPVGIESIDIDQPLGREVLVRTVATESATAISTWWTEGRPLIAVRR